MRRVALVFLGFLAGCGESPSEVTSLAEYDLVSIAGDPLPAAFNVLPSGQTTVELVASRIRLRPGNRGVESGRQRFPLNDNPAPVDFESPFTYAISGTTIDITYDCNDFASCIAGPHLSGQIRDDGVTFSQALGRTPLVYRKR